VSVANENIPRSDRERAEGFRSDGERRRSERVRARADGVWGVGDPVEAGT
jgi:hypothetical protein